MFLLFVQVGYYQNILKLRCWSLFWPLLPYIKLFLKNKKKSGTSYPASFSAQFLKKNVSQVIFYQLTKFHFLIVSTSWDIGQYVYCNYLRPICEVISFKINLSFLIKLFFYITKKLGQKYKYFKNEKNF